MLFRNVWSYTLTSPSLAPASRTSRAPTTLVEPETYFAHTEVKNGVVVPVSNYAPTEKVDDALAFVASVPDGSPWFGFDGPGSAALSACGRSLTGPTRRPSGSRAARPTRPVWCRSRSC